MSDDFISDELKSKILVEILQSQEFQNAPKFQELLQYLVDASISGDVIKESIIAIDFFQKDSNFDSSLDSSVRAYISILRKKLEYFYLTEGSDHPIRLTIPKGHYNVEFTTVAKQSDKRGKKGYRNYLYILFPTILCFIFFYLFFPGLLQKRLLSTIPHNNPVWHEFFDNSRKTLIVLGDYYFFSMPLKEDRQNYVRDIEINSDADLDAFIEANPEYKNRITKTYHTFLDEHLPICVSEILPPLLKYRVPFEIKMASEVHLDDFKKYNIVYIGSYKCLNLLEMVTQSLNFKYTPHKGSSTLEYFQRDSDTTYTFHWTTNPTTHARNDYAMVVKVSGLNQNIILMFLSEHDFGILGTVKYFTNPDKLREFHNRVNSNYFEALFEITGVVRTDFSINLLHFNRLHTDFKINLK